MWTELNSRVWALCLGLLLASIDTTQAYAQACCAGGSSLAPTRLDLHERALVGLQLGGSWLHGSHTPDGDYHGSAAGTSDFEARQTAFATIGLGQRVQWSVLVPWVETRRRAPGIGTEWGQGVGDISTTGRLEITQLNEYLNVPSVAALAGAVFPTGTTVDAAHLPLATDATGAGVYRMLLGAMVEETFAAWIVNVSATGSLAMPSEQAGIKTHYAPRWSLALSAGYAWSHRLSTAGLLLFETEGTTTVDSKQVPGTAKHRSEVTAVGTYTFDDVWRMQLRISLDPPISSLGANEPARTGANVAIVRSLL